MTLLLLTLLLAVVHPGLARAACDPAAVAAARATIASQCDCAAATSHGAYVHCVARAAKMAAKAGTLPRSCRGPVVRCAARSVCGKPGFVTCCVQKPKGPTCKLVRNALACTAKGGTASACPSCCDACTAGGCGATTTTTPGATTTTTLAGPATHTVMVGDGGLRFVPSTLTIQAGDTVRWHWATSGHSVVSGMVGAAGGQADGLFCSPNDTGCGSTPTSNAGATYEHTFPTAGTFPYFCKPHATLGMTGTIIVQ